jgi:hypothetical protein
MDRLVENEGKTVPGRDIVLGIQYGGHDIAERSGEAISASAEGAKVRMAAGLLERVSA